jgi:hypothetical protein
MDAHTWLRYFQDNRKGRTEPDWQVPCLLRPEIARPLARSLAHFQLGESGDGAFLLEQAALDARASRWRPALALFIAEEREHARLLAHLVDRFGGRLTRHHWTDFFFRRLRHAGGLEFELSVLVVAEMVGSAYYRLLLRYAPDPILREVCRIILRDEAQHVAFHIDHLGTRLRSALPLEHHGFGLRVQMLLAAATHVAWLDHGRALRSVGATRRDFFGSARHEGARFLRAVEVRRLQELPTCPTTSPNIPESLPSPAALPPTTVQALRSP